MIRELPARFREQVVDIVGPEACKDDPATRMGYARDLWPLLTLRMREGRSEAGPQLVAWPRTEQQVADVVALAHEHAVPLVPYGGGAGVCGGAMPSRGGLVLDVKRLNRTLSLDPRAGIIDVEPGIIGETLERQLAAQGHTLGHFPSSILCSTVGGFLAARSAGQCSSLYGKIEDMTLGLRVYTPGMGWVETGQYAPQTGTHDWTQVFLGSEGTLGVITRSLLRIHPQPQARLLRGMKFDSVEAGLDAFRRIMQADLRPAVLRLYDPLDTIFAMSLTHGASSDDDAEVSPIKRFTRKLKHRLKPDQLPLGTVLKGAPAINWAARMATSCLGVIGFEGETGAVTQADEEALAVILDAGGEDLGREPGERWYESRYHISFQLPKILQKDAFADTIEVAATWDRVPRLYKELREAMSPHAVVLAHFSHAYPEGCSIYFSISASAQELDEAEAVYNRIWEAAMEASLRVGGTVTHHHGTGMLKKHYSAREHGNGLKLYRAFKDRCDPGGICNPDKLYPEEVAP